MDIILSEDGDNENEILLKNLEEVEKRRSNKTSSSFLRELQPIKFVKERTPEEIETEYPVETEYPIETEYPTDIQIGNDDLIIDDLEFVIVDIATQKIDEKLGGWIKDFPYVIYKYFEEKDNLLEEYSREYLINTTIENKFISFVEGINKECRNLFRYTTIYNYRLPYRINGVLAYGFPGINEIEITSVRDSYPIIPKRYIVDDIISVWNLMSGYTDKLDELIIKNSTDEVIIPQFLHSLSNIDITTLTIDTTGGDKKNIQQAFSILNKPVEIENEDIIEAFTSLELKKVKVMNIFSEFYKFIGNLGNTKILNIESHYTEVGKHGQTAKLYKNDKPTIFYHHFKSDNLIKAINNSECLEQLNIKDMKFKLFTPDEIFNILENNKTLKELTLYNIFFKKEDIFLLSKILNKNKKIKKIFLKPQPSLNKKDKLYFTYKEFKDILKNTKIISFKK